jgi:hypothetical protein
MARVVKAPDFKTAVGGFCFSLFCFFFFPVLGFELRAYPLSYSTSPFS